jgi:membrane protein
MGTMRTMGEVEDRRADADRDQASDAGRTQRARTKLTAAMASAKSASEEHVALAVPLRAAERNRRVAASVLAGGIAYRVFLWLLPFGLIVGGALGFLNAGSTEKAVSKGGLPGAISNAIGDASRSAHSNSWWLLAVGVPLLLWAGFSGAKAVQLVHSLVWDEPPHRTKPLQGSLAFTGVLLAVWAIIGLTWWVRGDWPGVFAPLLTFAPLTGLWLWVSLHLPHKDAPWKALLPGALLVGIGFPVLHELVLSFLVPKLEKSTSLYGGLGATTTVIFFIYLLATLVVTAPILNSSLYQELSRKAG